MLREITIQFLSSIEDSIFRQFILSYRIFPYSTTCNQNLTKGCENVKKDLFIVLDNLIVRSLSSRIVCNHHILILISII